MIKAIAIDDEPLALELIETFCSPLDYILLEKTFTNTGAALQYLKKNPVDLLFLDINMPSISGITFYRSLPYKPMLIFTTSYSEYAIESYDLEAIDYLLKPFTAKRFEKAVQKAYEKYKLISQRGLPDEARFLLLKADYGLVKVALDNIIFIEGLDNYLKIYLHNQNPLVVRMTMKALQEKLPGNRFIRVHRSYIVSLLRIETVRNKIINIAGEEIPIGTSYEGNFFSQFKS